MKTKITMKDIAREAGVSVATVSYVLNNRAEARISEETRKKVLQIVNLLNYTPNQSAKALATNRSRNIAVYLPVVECSFSMSEQLHFLNSLSDVLFAHQYNLLYLCQNKIRQVDNVDAILCYNIDTDEFLKIGDINFVPLLAIDSRIDHFLFFQIISDYKKCYSLADAYFSSQEFIFASLTMKNKHSQEEVEAIFPHVVFVKTPADLHSLKGKNVFVMEYTLNELLKSSCNLYYRPSITSKKLEKVMEYIEFAIDRLPIEDHNILV